MSSEYVIDSYAWVEYFKGSKTGEVARKYIESEGSITPTIVIAELAHKYAREGWDFWKADLEFIEANSALIELTAKLAEDAGIINAEMKKKDRTWGMSDSIVLATGKKYNVKVVTGDEHFRNLDNAVMIK